MRNTARIVLWMAVGQCLVFAETAPAEDAGITMLDQPPASLTNAPWPVAYWHESLSEPRPVQIHVVMIDLLAPQYEMVAAIGSDPDGNGPAEARQEDPLKLASSNGLIAAVNANGFQLNILHRYAESRPVNILGWAKNAEREASPPQSGYASFWIDPDGGGHTGNLDKPVAARASVAGIGHLMQEGSIPVAAGGSVQPRSALGIDSDGRILWLVVVDGRRGGYSEGMTKLELAQLMESLGCWNAINMDGGGSSVMLVAPGQEGLKIMNRPCGSRPRPVPVMIGVRKRTR